MTARKRGLFERFGLPFKKALPGGAEVRRATRHNMRNAAAQLDPQEGDLRVVVPEQGPSVAAEPPRETGPEHTEPVHRAGYVHEGENMERRG